MRRKFILQLTCLLLPLLGFSLTGARAQTQNHKPIEISLNKNLKTIIGSSEPIWHIWLIDHHSRRNSSILVFRSLEIVLVPFRSSSEFCRTYAIYLQSPHPWVDVENSYRLSSSLYISFNKSGTPCSKLSFKRDYFSVKPDSSDSYIKDSMKALQVVLSDWRKKRKDGACGAKELDMSDLKSIDLSPLESSSNVIYRFTCGNEKTSAQQWRIFYVWVNDDWSIKKYKTGLVME